MVTSPEVRSSFYCDGCVSVHNSVCKAGGDQIAESIVSLLCRKEMENSEVSPPADRPVRLKITARGPYHYRRRVGGKLRSSGQVETCDVSASADEPVRVKLCARGRPGWRCDEDGDGTESDTSEESDHSTVSVVSDRLTRWTKEKTIAFVSTYSF